MTEDWYKVSAKSLLLFYLVKWGTKDMHFVRTVLDYPSIRRRPFF